METIFSTRIENKLKSQPKLLLKTNASLKKLGFNRAIDNARVDNGLFYKEEIVFIESHENYYDNRSINGELLSEITNLIGYSSSSLKVMQEIPNGALEFKYKDNVLGFYHKERNYFLSYYPFIRDSMVRVGEKNEIIPFFIDLLEKFLEENSLEIADVSEVGKQIIAEQFNDMWVSRKNELTSRIESSQRDITSYSTRLKNSYDNVKLHLSERKQIDTELGNGMKKVTEVLEKIDKLKFVKSLEIEDNCIVVEYGDVSIKHRGRDIYMGDYIAKIGTDKLEIINRKPILVVNNEEDIKTNNFHRTIHHPHISGNDTEHICFGSSRDVDITKFKSNLQYDIVAHLIFLFLNTYTESDGGYERMFPWIHQKDNDSKRYYVYNSDDRDTDGEITE